MKHKDFTWKTLDVKKPRAKRGKILLIKIGTKGEQIERLKFNVTDPQKCKYILCRKPKNLERFIYVYLYYIRLYIYIYLYYYYYFITYSGNGIPETTALFFIIQI